MYDALNEDVRGKLVTAPFPKGSGSEVALMSGWNLGVFANSKNKDMAFKFLEYKAAIHFQRVVAKIFLPKKFACRLLQLRLFPSVGVEYICSWLLHMRWIKNL